MILKWFVEAPSLKFRKHHVRIKLLMEELNFALVKATRFLQTKCNFRLKMTLDFVNLVLNYSASFLAKKSENVLDHTFAHFLLSSHFYVDLVDDSLGRIVDVRCY